MNIVRWAANSIKEKGIAQTGLIAISLARDILFDFRYGTDTLRQVARDALDTSSPNRAHAVQYQATKAKPLDDLLKELRLPGDAVFVDIGCGKGRVLLLAAQHDFRAVRGIEFAGDLCAIARKNVAIFAQRVALKATIEIIQADAVNYEFRSDDNVLFMYNPFGSAVMERVMANLRDSLAAYPRPIWLIYNNPKHHDVVMRSGIFHAGKLVVLGGSHFRVYTNA